VQGNFWINTAEASAGPYGGNSASVDASEAYTGILRSTPFTITGETIELWVGGTMSPTTYVALVDAQNFESLRQETGSGSDVMSRRQWTVSDLKGLRVAIEIVDHNPNGHVSVDAIRETGGALAVGRWSPAEDGLRLSALPNPAPGWTSFRISHAEALTGARLSIYDVHGRRIRQLARDGGASGDLVLAWDGRRDDGRRAGAGVYVARLEAAGVRQTASIRIALLR
jgi:hypothetical protein